MLNLALAGGMQYNEKNKTEVYSEENLQAERRTDDGRIHRKKESIILEASEEARIKRRTLNTLDIGNRAAEEAEDLEER